MLIHLLQRILGIRFSLTMSSKDKRQMVYISTLRRAQFWMNYSFQDWGHQRSKSTMLWESRLDYLNAISPEIRIEFPVISARFSVNSMNYSLHNTHTHIPNTFQSAKKSTRSPAQTLLATPKISPPTFLVFLLHSSSPHGWWRNSRFCCSIRLRCELKTLSSECF